MKNFQKLVKTAYPKKRDVKKIDYCMYIYMKLFILFKYHHSDKYHYSDKSTL